MSINGLRYLLSFIDEADEAALLAAIHAEPWRQDLQRRTQHYGYRYDYKARRADPSMFLGPLPGWVAPVIARLSSDAIMPVAPDQLIVNEYEPGQGITAHIDCVPCFGPVICSLSLGSACVMDFESDDKQKESLLLERRSLLVLAGDARYRWRHSIAKRKADRIGDRAVARARRVSLTFRTVLVAP